MSKKLLFTAILSILLISSSGAASPYSPSNNRSAAFLDGNVISLVYTGNYLCTPSLTSLYSNVSAIANITNCAVVVPKSVIGTFPIWAIIPSFSGFSIYGYSLFNSTIDGYPTYNGNVIVTDCSAGSTPSACSNNPPDRYSPIISSYEKSFSIYNGIGGLPEGLLPIPARDYVMLNDYGNLSTPLYVVFVRVFDPNIFPNATTGKCRQVAPSNLSDPTANCLASFGALRRALLTRNSYIPAINNNNYLWELESNSSKQVVIVTNNQNITGISGLVYPNSNLYLYVQANRSNFYNSTTTGPVNTKPDLGIIAIGILVIIIILLNILMFRKRLNTQNNYVKPTKKGRKS